MEKKKVTKKQINEKLSRLIKQEKAEKAKIKHVKLSFMENRFGPLVFALLFAGAGSFFIFKSSAAPQPANAPSAPAVITEAQHASGSIWLVQGAQTVKVGTMVTAEIWVDTASEQVNAVQADLAYPVDKLAFVSIDGSTSAFSIQAQADGSKGKVIIARGNVSPVSGKKLIAKVTFRAITDSGEATISVSDSSSILRSADNSNILSNRTGAIYTLTN